MVQRSLLVVKSQAEATIKVRVVCGWPPKCQRDQGRACIHEVAARCVVCALASAVQLPISFRVSVHTGRHSTLMDQIDQSFLFPKKK